ncbi:MFS transporter [Pantoea sp. At-9b]|uniref:CynX/NimT family MFS transporter n=1 Tax=Pantoea sp. (strain At-9b) TaxID=592316 RepID=UPI0001B3FD7B|nr:MFS transporter [Pantoea sp. At-9b]ADU71411.1 major facilitator superfamily MFS_1 [Pantoea sp. At-9b]
MTHTVLSANPALRRSGFFLFLLLLTAANLRTPITATGPVLENIRQTFGLSASAAGILNFLPLLMFATLAPPAAWLGNRFGLERSLWGALLLITLGSLLRITGSEKALWAGTLLLSAGIAAANVLLPPLIKRDFTAHTARYIGLYATTMAITASIASGVAVPLAQLTGVGWHLSLGIWLVPGMVALLAWLPQLQHVAVHTQPTASQPLQRSPWRSALGWQVSLFMACQSLVFYTLIGWFTPFAQDEGISQLAAGWLLFVYQIVAIVANLACMSALKRLHDQRAIGFLASLAIFSGVMGLLLAPGWALIWLLLAGLGAGASMVTCLALFNLRTHDHRQASKLSGMAQCVGYGVAALGPLCFGMLHDASGSWTLPLVLLLVIALLQMAVATLAGRNRHI